MKQDTNLKLGIKKNIKCRLIQNKHGQAVIEYVLLLIVTISMLLAAKGMFTGFNNFMNSYMGTYISCLMEYGELPSLGVQDADLNKNKSGDGGGAGCDSKFKGFTLAGGRPPGGSSTSGSVKNGNSNSANSGNNQNANKNSNNSSSSNTKNSANQSSSENDSVLGNTSGRNSPYTNGKINRTNSSFHAADSSSVGNDKVKVIDDDEEGPGGGRGRSGARGNRQTRIVYEQTKYKQLSGNALEEIEKKSKASARKPSSKSIASIADEGYRLGPVKKTFTPPKAEQLVVEEKEEGFSFGGIIRWLLIAGMVIAIVILFGGQIMNYSNSQDS